jgi:DNA-binding SARP family transcriptional activator
VLVGKAAGVAVVLGIEKDGTDTTSSTVHAPVFEDRMAYSRSPEPAMRGGLIARNRELAHIDQLLWRARRGAGGVVALHGEPGVGKTVLVEAAVARATEFRTMQVRGNPTGEPAAVPQDWPSPLGELASRLDGFVAEELCFEPIGSTQQRVEPTRAPAAAVEAVAAALRRMAESANAPLLVTVDDCQSLPAGFIDALASAVLTHLVDEPVSLILAWRDSPHLTTFRLHRADVPQHRLSGLTLQQAVQLMTSRFETIPAEPVLSELVARTIGNPLVLADVYGRLTPEQLDGWHPLPDPLPVGEVVVEAYDVVRRLPPATRQALTVAAAARAPRDVVIAAMKQLGVDGSDLAPAVEAGIVVERGPRIDFAHPLVRAAAFRRAPADVRQAVRRALSDELAKGQAIESSAYHASIDANGPDPLATRRLGEAARVALDRGDPEAAARHEEFAARFAAESNVAQHLVAAAGHWQDAGRRDRALHCVVLAAGLPASGAVRAEILYQRARLEPDEGEASVADRMVEAAELCLADAPNRALAMLIDAAAWRVLAGELVGAEALADRTVRQAGTISSHAEVLAGAVRGAVLLAAGRPVEELAERSRVSLLIGQTERFPSSPEVALVIGHSLLRQGLWRQVDRWAHWIERCADHSGDRALAAVPLLLRASVLLVEGAFVDARRLATDGARTAERNGTVAVAAWGWNLVLQLHALTGDHQGGFRDCAKLFAASDRTGSLARLRSLPALALLELQRRRTGPAMAWARTAMADLDPWLSEEPGPLGAVAVEVAPVIASVMLLARSPAPPEQWGSLLHETAGGGAADVVPPAYRAWLRGVSGTDPAAALADLSAASAGLAGVPTVRALVDLCWGVRSAEAGLAREAQVRFELVERWAVETGAMGIAGLARRELQRLPSTGEPAAGAPAMEERPGDPAGGTPDTVTEWEISLLGGFSVRQRGTTVHLPPSLATQAIKIVTLQPRITADELIELLWEDAEPGVGARRLRNVLWRVRSACGDLLVREGNFVRLGAGAETDVNRFEALSEQALVGPDAGSAAAAQTARAAVKLYRGELLPGDRYADWTTGPRESVARTYLRLLDLLVDDALAGDRKGEALVLLDRLAEADPFNERHHLRTAEIHLESGNRGRALDALERAERTLEDLQVAPSPAVQRLRASLDHA